MEISIAHVVCELKPLNSPWELDMRRSKHWSVSTRDRSLCLDSRAMSASCYVQRPCVVTPCAVARMTYSSSSSSSSSSTISSSSSRSSSISSTSKHGTVRQIADMDMPGAKELEVERQSRPREAAGG